MHPGGAVLSLYEWGWSDFFAQSVPENTELAPGRVLAVHREQYLVITEAGECRAELSGRLLYASESPADLPSAGDWVLLRLGVIDSVLPRRTLLTRKGAGKRVEEEVIAANIDVLFIVSGLDLDLNPRRLERYLVLAAASGAEPVIVLNKADLCADLERVAARVRSVAAGRPVLLTSAESGQGVEAIEALLPPGTTGALIGSSGAGKSTLVNALLGTAAQPTQPVRVDDRRGRHTATPRQLFRLRSGGLLLDQPGLREIQLWAWQGSLAAAFPDIAELAEDCRFRDCNHRGEPGCAVEGAVDPSRL